MTIDLDHPGSGPTYLLTFDLTGGGSSAGHISCDSPAGTESWDSSIADSFGGTFSGGVDPSTGAVFNLVPSLNGTFDVRESNCRGPLAPPFSGTACGPVKVGDSYSWTMDGVLKPDAGTADGTLKTQWGPITDCCGWSGTGTWHASGAPFQWPSGSGGASAGPGAPAAISPGVACDPSQIEPDGNVACTATLVNAPIGTAVTWEWYVDGALLPETGPLLALSGLKPGNHEIQVVANVGGERIGPADSSVVRADPCATASRLMLAEVGPFGSCGFGLPQLGIAAGGGALAISAAVAVLLGRRVLSRRRRPTSVPGGAGAAFQPPPVPFSPVVAPAPPQSSRSDDPRRPLAPPWIKAVLHLRTSVRTRGTFGDADPHIWGDGIDLLYATYDFEVASGWSVNQSMAGAFQEFWSASPGSAKAAQEFTAEAQSRGWGWAIPSLGSIGAARAVVRTSWSTVDTRLSVGLDVSAWLIDDRGNIAQATASANPQSVLVAQAAVIGAKPHLILTADRDGDADGTMVVNVAPALQLFDSYYAGGLHLVLPLEGPSDIDRYFELDRRSLTGGQGGLARRDDRAQQSVALRCRFQLSLASRADDIPTVPVSFRVEPTGAGPDTVVDAELDWMAAEHYAVVQQNLDVRAYTVEPAVVGLRPSRIVVEPPDPGDLPWKDAPTWLVPSGGEDQYRTRLKARVVSASKAPVSGDVIRHDRGDNPDFARGAWWLALRADPPRTGPMVEWDPCTAPTAFYADGSRGPAKCETKVDVSGVDDGGYLLFAASGSATPVAWYEYDHWSWFDPTTRYLSGQCTAISVTVHADGLDVPAAEPPIRLHIWPPPKLYVYAETNEGGIVGHVFVGLVNTEGEEVRAGLYPTKWFQRGEGVDPIQISVDLGTAVLFGAGAMLAVETMGVSYFLIRGMAAVVVGAGGLVVGEVAGSYGVGALMDDRGHNFDVCRSWDLTSAEHETVLALLRDWKAKSDRHELFYDVTGAAALALATAGNCCTLAARACAAVGIPTPVDPAANLTRPSTIADELGNGRPERQNLAKPSDFEHPWTYRKRPKDRQPEIDRVLGSWPRAESVGPIIVRPGVTPALPPGVIGPMPPPPNPTIPKPIGLQPKP